MQEKNPIKVRLRKKRGRGWQYQEIEIPTDAEMERIALDLHAKNEPALIECLGWKVFYNPAKPFRYPTTKVDPFTGQQGETTHHNTRTFSYCVFGYGAEWQVCYSWAADEKGSPRRIQEKGDIVPMPEHSQENLFDGRKPPSEVDDGEMLFEGAITRSELNIHERNREARELCIQHYGPTCFVCGFDFGSIYGDLASGFIHVHHLKQLAEIIGESVVDPIQDLRPVCPNCHSVLHMRTPPFTIEEVKGFLSRRQKPIG